MSDRTWITAPSRAAAADTPLLLRLRAAYWNDRPDVTWMEGGCWVFAKALRHVFGGTYLSVWTVPGAVGQDSGEFTAHVGVELPEHPGWVFDAKGGHRVATWFRRHSVFGPYAKEVPPSMIADRLVRGVPVDHAQLFHDAAITTDLARELRKRGAAPQRDFTARPRART